MTDRRPSDVRIGILLFLALAAICAYLSRHCIAVTNTRIQQELNLDQRQMGWIMGAFAIGYFICQIPAGWLGNRIGARAALSLLSLVWSLCNIWTACSSSYLPLLFSRVGVGLAQAGLVPISLKVINDWFPVSRRGICCSTFGAAMSIGSLITMGLTAHLLTSWGWRHIFGLYSLAGIAWSLAFFAYFRDRPGQSAATTDDESQQPPDVRSSRAAEVSHLESPSACDQVLEIQPIGGQTVDPSSAVPVNPNAWRIVSFLLCGRTIWGIYLQAIFKSAGYQAFVTWFPAFLEYRYQISPTQSGTLTMYPIGSIIVGHFCGGFLIDWLLKRTGNRWLSRCGVGGAALGICAVFVFSSSLTESSDMFLVLISAGALSSGAAGPAMYSVTMDVSGPFTSLTVAAMNMASTLGGLLTPVALGYLIGSIQITGGNWNHVVYFIAVVYLAGSLSCLAIDPEVRSSPKVVTR